MKVLVIEDNSLIRQALEQGLMGLGCNVEVYATAATVVHSEQIREVDVILLDLGLPDIHGFEVIRILRKQRVAVPICILTALDDTESVIKALDLGADDYVHKPFNLKELYARLRALHRRNCAQLGQVLVSQRGNVTMDLDQRVVTYENQTIELSKVEFELLQHLVQKSPNVLTKEYLEQNISTDKLEHQSNFLEVHVHHIRKKMGKDIIKTIRGIGYQLND